MARASLEALWAAPPFGLDASTLVLASGGALARVHSGELLLFESHLGLDATGRGVETVRSVYRVLNDASDQTRVFTWSPWRQKRPIIRGRVVSPDGTESRVEPASIVEGSVTVSGIELSDVRQLSVVLPNVCLGSVVELEIIREDTRPVLEGAGVMGNWDLWSFEPLRRVRLSVQAPVSVPLKVEVVGVDPPAVHRHGDAHRVTLDVEVPRFSPFALTLPELREKAPRFTWSTAESWSKVAQRYRTLVEPAFADQIDLSSLEPLMARATSREERIAAVQRWLSERVRYTAVNLGDGAVAPTLPSVVLSRGYGDCKDMAVLAAIALGRSGVPADVALVMAEGPPARDGTPGLGAFNHMIVHVPGREPDVKEVWLDVTARGYPVGSVPSAVREQRALIISEGTSGLSPTPSRADSRFVVTQRFELTAASFGAGSGAATLEFVGAAEGAVRAAVAGCDEGVAHELAEPTVKKVMGDSPFRASLSGCRPGEGPITVTVQRHELAALDTGDQRIEVRFPSRIVDDVVPAWLPGVGPAPSDTRTEAQKKDQWQRTFDRTGHTEEELGRRAASFENRPTIERIDPSGAPAPLRVRSLAAESHARDGPLDMVRVLRSCRRGHRGGAVPLRGEPGGLVGRRGQGLSPGLVEALRGADAGGDRRLRAPRVVAREEARPGDGSHQEVAHREAHRWRHPSPLRPHSGAAWPGRLGAAGDRARLEGRPLRRAGGHGVRRRRPARCLRRRVPAALPARAGDRMPSPGPGDRSGAQLDHRGVGRHAAPQRERRARVEVGGRRRGGRSPARGDGRSPRGAAHRPRDAFGDLPRAGKVNDTQALLDAEPALKDAQGPLKTLLEVLSQGTQGFLRRAEQIAKPRTGSRPWPWATAPSPTSGSMRRPPPS